jgi:hypothetical protein
MRLGSSGGALGEFLSSAALAGLLAGNASSSQLSGISGLAQTDRFLGGHGSGSTSWFSACDVLLVDSGGLLNSSLGGKGKSTSLGSSLVSSILLGLLRALLSLVVASGFPRSHLGSLGLSSSGSGGLSLQSSGLSRSTSTLLVGLAIIVSIASGTSGLHTSFLRVSAEGGLLEESNTVVEVVELAAWVGVTIRKLLSGSMASLVESVGRSVGGLLRKTSLGGGLFGKIVSLIGFFTSDLASIGHSGGSGRRCLNSGSSLVGSI